MELVFLGHGSHIRSARSSPTASAVTQWRYRLSLLSQSTNRGLEGCPRPSTRLCLSWDQSAFLAPRPRCSTSWIHDSLHQDQGFARLGGQCGMRAGLTPDRTDLGWGQRAGDWCPPCLIPPEGGSQSLLIHSWCLGGRMGVGLCALISPSVT